MIHPVSYIPSKDKLGAMSTNLKLNILSSNFVNPLHRFGQDISTNVKFEGAEEIRGEPVVIIQMEW